MAGKPSVSTDVIDSVLAEFGRPSAPRTPTAKSSRSSRSKGAAPDGLAQLEKLFRKLFPSDLQGQLEPIVTQLCGREFSSLEANRSIVDRLNRILRGSDLCFISEDGTPVRLRLVKPARSAHGYFQLRSADAFQKTVYSGRTFPRLRLVANP